MKKIGFPLFCSFLCLLTSGQSFASSSCVNLLAKDWTVPFNSIALAIHEAFGGALYSVRDRTAFANELELVNARHRITENITANEYEYFRGMQVSAKTIVHILNSGMDVKRTGFEHLYFGKYPATAAYYALLPTGAEPEHDVPLFPVIFRVDVRGLSYVQKDESVIKIPNLLPAKSITGVWILDTRPEARAEFVDAIRLFRRQL